mgnify:FL=1
MNKEIPTIEGDLTAPAGRVALVVSRFNAFITDRLVEGAVDCLTRHGVAREQLVIARVPGAWEIPMAARRMVHQPGLAAVVCLGAVIRGGTPHFDYVAAEVSKAVAQIGLEAPVPVSFGVLTTDSIEQAIERAGTKAGNKGWEAALAALEMANLYGALEAVGR